MYLSADSNDVGVAFYSGGGPYGSGSAEGDVNNRDHTVRIQSDTNNTNQDEVGDGVVRVHFAGAFNDTPRNLDKSVTFRRGNRYFARDESTGTPLQFLNTLMNDSSESIRLPFLGASETEYGAIEVDGSGTMTFNGASLSEVNFDRNDIRQPAKYSDDTNAPNDTLYYDTTDAQLEYKDDGGTIHNLG